MSTPFATPLLAVLDVTRVLIAAGGFLLVGMYLQRRWPTVDGPQERARVIGMAVALFTLAASRITNLGGPVTWQFFASVVVFVLVGYSAMRNPRGWRE